MKNDLLTQSFFPRSRRIAPGFALAVSLLWASVASAQTNSVVFAPAAPNVGASLIRVIGALALVLGLFLGAVWFIRNWQRLMVQRGRAPKLNVLEVRSLGGRQSIYVVGYHQERFLLASSPNGVNFLSHLPTADAETPESTDAPPTPSFAQTLKQMLKGK